MRIDPAALSPLDTAAKAVALFAPTIDVHAGRPLRIAFLDGDLRLIALRFIEWTENLTVAQHINDVAREAFAFGAANVIIARRKLEDQPLACNDFDRAYIPAMSAALAPLAITLRDGIIIAPEGYLSMAEEGALSVGEPCRDRT